MRTSKGFSLIELMVAVGIVAILSSIAVNSYQTFQRKAKQAEAKSLLGGIYKAQKIFFNEWNQYYPDLDVIGFIPSGRLRYEAGFAAAGAAIATIIPDYTGMQGAGLFRTGLLCATAAYASQCAKLGSGIVGPPSFAVNPSGVGSLATFTAAAETTAILLGGRQNDVWTINQLGQFSNPVSGL
jgi:type IV pilus assembly protein PilA